MGSTVGMGSREARQGTTCHGARREGRGEPTWLGASAGYAEEAPGWVRDAFGPGRVGHGAPARHPRETEDQLPARSGRYEGPDAAPAQRPSLAAMSRNRDDFAPEPRAVRHEDLLAGPTSAAGRARELLRGLRDLDLGARIAVRRDLAVELAGCASRDEPVERGVRYRLRDGDGREETLSLAWREGALEVHLAGGSRWRRLRAALSIDALGRLAAPALGVRLDSRHGADARATGRFLRRVVRAAYAGG